MFDSQPFQRSSTKRRRRSDNAQQTNSTHDLKKRETNAKGNIDLDFDILSINRRRIFVFASTIFATLEEDSSTTLFAS